MPRGESLPTTPGRATIRAMSKLQTAAAILSATLAVGARALGASEPKAPHPEPRVIVTVTALEGAHDQQAVQRSAREAWGRIVRCYKESGRRERGKLVLRLDISARGKAVGVRRLQSSLNDRVSACLAETLRRKALPRASGGSRATVEIQLAPGDS